MKTWLSRIMKLGLVLGMLSIFATVSLAAREMEVHSIRTANGVEVQWEYLAAHKDKDVYCAAYDRDGKLMTIGRVDMNRHGKAHWLKCDPDRVGKVKLFLIGDEVEPAQDVVAPEHVHIWELDNALSQPGFLTEGEGVYSCTCGESQTRPTPPTATPEERRIVSQAEAEGLLKYMPPVTELGEITKLEFCKVLAGMMQLEIDPVDDCGYIDCAGLTDEEKGLVALMVEDRLVMPADETHFMPEKTITRASTVEYLYYRCLGQTPNSSEIDTTAEAVAGLQELGILDSGFDLSGINAPATKADVLDWMMRTRAWTQSNFVLTEGEELVIEDTRFTEDVTIYGDNARITFVNCTFEGDLINTAEVGTMVVLTGSTEVKGQCIIDNNTQEANWETDSFPKFVTEVPVDVVCEDNYGNLVVVRDIAVTFNGQSYTMADCEYYYQYQSGEFFPYEGQQAEDFFISQWWENGEKQFLIACEGDGAVQEFDFVLAEGEEREVCDAVFENNVTVTGDNARITFVNCTFEGNLINNAEVGTMVVLTGSTEVKGQCIIDNNTQEANWETDSFPKFVTEVPVDVVCEDNYGNLVVVRDIAVTFNGQSYTMADCEYYYQYQSGEFFPYEGQQAEDFFISQWWENGEKQLLIACEGAGAVQEFDFVLAEGEEREVWDTVFENDVTVTGDNARITFVNCVFEGNLINNAEVGTMVVLTGNTTVNGKCIIENNTQEANWETDSFPKFVTEVPVDVVCEDNYGNLAVLGDIAVTFNGQSYTMADCKNFYRYGMVFPYEDQQADFFYVFQWWENGQEQLGVMAEKDEENDPAYAVTNARFELLWDVPQVVYDAPAGVTGEVIYEDYILQADGNWVLYQVTDEPRLNVSNFGPDTCHGIKVVTVVDGVAKAVTDLDDLTLNITQGSAGTATVTFRETFTRGSKAYECALTGGSPSARAMIHVWEQGNGSSSMAAVLSEYGAYTVTTGGTHTIARIENGQYMVREFEDLVISADGKTCTFIAHDTQSVPCDPQRLALDDAYAVTNARFEMWHGAPALVWDAPQNVSGDVRYEFHMRNMENGWGYGRGTERTNVTFYYYDPGTYGEITIVTVVDDEIKDIVELDGYTINITDGGDSSAVATFEENYDTGTKRYECTVTGGTANGSFGLSVEGSDGEGGYEGGTFDANGVGSVVMGGNYQMSAIETGNYRVVEYDECSVSLDGKTYNVIYRDTQWKQCEIGGGSAPAQKLTDVPTDIQLFTNAYYALGLTYTKPSNTDLIDKISAAYDVNGTKLTRNFSVSMSSTGLLANYTLLTPGVNTIQIDFTSVPTAAAESEGYTAGTTSFTATVNYQEEQSTADTSQIVALFTDATDSSGAVVSGKKKLTVTGLQPYQSYQVAVQEGDDGTVNYRELTTDAQGTGVSEWYTSYAFDRCTISEWEVSNLTDTSADVVCRTYDGVFYFAVAE